MKKILFTLILLFTPLLSFAAVHVNGYFRSNGTYVAPHYRSNPDGNPYNNYSYPGNINPYTGVTAGGNSTTYLNNYYGGFLPSYGSVPSYTPPSTTVTSDPVYGGKQADDSRNATIKFLQEYTQTLNNPSNTSSYTPSYFSRTEKFIYSTVVKAANENKCNLVAGDAFETCNEFKNPTSNEVWKIIDPTVDTNNLICGYNVYPKNSCPLGSVASCEGNSAYCVQTTLTPSPTPTIKVQNITALTTKENITNLQKFLEKDNFLIMPNVPYGIFGSLTKDALRRFQKKFNLVPSGVLDEATVVFINSQLSN